MTWCHCKQHVSVGFLVLQLANELGCCKIGWSCLDDNTEALAFYGSIGGKAMEQLTRIRIDREGIRNIVSNFVQLSSEVNIRIGTQEDVQAVCCLIKV